MRNIKLIRTKYNHKKYVQMKTTDIAKQFFKAKGAIGEKLCASRNIKFTLVLQKTSVDFTTH